ncbi:hypothetical protein [Akkermansia glycaniphila]|uniref:Uncharacterized protein n=1 Tax=Akkermansia glycaniphila TaxID=1679444 RepID=A0A1C7PE79_9BACT|nr:hypothetical protein [Akkermansia glycaniphila]OCA03694.1 hypothetical protein AC781_03105 [Akkermansia glycaniphila]SEH82296.1 Hypothetical protein PYTT_1007 [Akkermansia glycaniphila]
MSRRTARKKKAASPHKLYLAIGIPVAVLIIVIVVISLSGKQATTAGRFDTSSYMNAGSGITGNRYIFEGKVDNILTVDNDSLLSVIPAGNTDKNIRLPLILKKDAAGNVNVTRNSSYIFEVLCRNGRDANGDTVKGILLIKTITPK